MRPHALLALMAVTTLIACRSSIQEPSPIAPTTTRVGEQVAPSLEDTPEEAPVPEAIPDEEDPPPRAPSACNEQAADVSLIRSSYREHLHASPAERARRHQLAAQSIEVRTRRYGYVDGFGDPKWNRNEPKALTAAARFFGIPVRMNRRVLGALACVEEDLKASCADTPYTPHKLDTLRFKNTFHNTEVSNHVYGIAIDVDWDTNPCCGCVAPLSNDPRCKRPSSSPFDRTNLPACWVETFERYGFYWLGHDELEDTMHFEFLGDPDKILKAPEKKG